MTAPVQVYNAGANTINFPIAFPNATLYINFITQAVFAGNASGNPVVVSYDTSSAAIANGYNNYVPLFVLMIGY
jgi:hypothetical protein